MSFNINLWGVEGNQLVSLTRERLDREDRLEEWIANDTSLLGLRLLVIARQLPTPFGGRVDLLAIQENGDLVLLELKRDKTPREVVAQALDYASWVATLTPLQVTEIAQEYLQRPFDQSFLEYFGNHLPEVINNDHQIVIVASNLDDSSERIVQYLSVHHSIDINVVFFSCFRDGNKELVGRAWLLNPEENRQRVQATKSPSWTGAWFVNVGESGEHDFRNWDDCRKYGFLSAGWGRQYTDPLSRLAVGSQVFAYMKGRGYVGCGTVLSEACPAKDYIPKGTRKCILDLPLEARDMSHTRNDLDQCEWVVGVAWHKTFDREKAKFFTGAFANQHIVCKLRDPQTLDFLTREFGVSLPSVT